MLSVASFAVPPAGRARPGFGERTIAADPRLDAAGLPVDRGVRAGPAFPPLRFDFAEWVALLPALLDDCEDDAESVEPPSVVAEATPWPAATAMPSPTAAARIPLRAARLELTAACFRCRPACLR